MTITVFGASGNVGRLLVAELLRRGHNVTAFSHSHPVTERVGLRVVSGDIADRAAVTQAIAGSQAVISVLGSWKAKGFPVLTTAMERIIPAMEAAGITRLISLTGDLASMPGEPRSLFRAAATALFNVVAAKLLRDGDDHLALLAASSLDWTVIRSPVMVGQGTAYKLTATGHGLAISRAAVATALADLLESSDWQRAAPFIGRG